MGKGWGKGWGREEREGEKVSVEKGETCGAGWVLGELLAVVWLAD